MGYLTIEASRDIKLWRESERGRGADARLRLGGVPERDRCPLGEVTPRPYQEGAYKRLLEYVDEFLASWRLGKGLMLVGPPGNGKTHLACALASTLVIEHKYVVAFTRLNDYVKSVQALMSVSKMLNDPTSLGADAREEYGNLKHMHWVYQYGAYLLVLDDVGKEYRAASGWAAGEFEALLRGRYDFGLPTIITTNMPMESWDDEYSESMRSFVEEACPSVKCW